MKSSAYLSAANLKDTNAKLWGTIVLLEYGREGSEVML